MNHELTKGQIIALEKLNNFLTSPDKVFILTGAAGRGKTYLLKIAIDNYLAENNSRKVLGITFAHKAKNVLRKSISNVSTFAKAYGYEEVINKNGNRDFLPNKKKLKVAFCKQNFDVFIMDEVSMFSQDMLDIINKETNLYTKIIYVGDRGQLPPVINGEEIDNNSDSPIFLLDVPENCKHELTEAVRQTKDNPIIEISNIIYQEIFGNQDLNKVINLLKKSYLINNKGIMPLNENHLYLAYRKSTDIFIDTKVIAYRNKAVDGWNAGLRKYIYENADNEVIKGEVIFMNDTFKLPYDRPVYCYNSDEYIVNSFYSEKVHGLDTWKIFVYDDNEEYDKEKFINVLKKDSLNEYYAILQKYANKKAWKLYWDFKACFANYSHGFAITTYKAQGSTYKNIFVDLEDIIGVKVISNKRKLQTLYTAITRASDNVFILFKNNTTI